MGVGLVWVFVINKFYNRLILNLIIPIQDMAVIWSHVMDTPGHTFKRNGILLINLFRLRREIKSLLNMIQYKKKLDLKKIRVLHLKIKSL
jgi:hypothetical protein